MLTPFISSFRIESTIIFAATIVTGMSYWNDCSSSSRSNNNKTRGRLWNRPTTSGAPLGTHLDLVDGNRSQSGTPHGISHSERAPSGNNLTSAGSPSGTNMPNGLPMDNTTSANQTETDNALWQTKNLRTYDEQTCSSSLKRNDNIEIGQLRKRPTASGNSLGTHLDLVYGNRS